MGGPTEGHNSVDVLSHLKTATTVLPFGNNLGQTYERTDRRMALKKVLSRIEKLDTQLILIEQARVDK